MIPHPRRAAGRQPFVLLLRCVFESIDVSAFQACCFIWISFRGLTTPAEDMAALRA